jgi:hypothetical protein
LTNNCIQQQARSPASCACSYLTAHSICRCPFENCYFVTFFLQAELVTLQSLLKGFSAEVMQLVLQMRNEQCSSNSPISVAAASQHFPANPQPHQHQDVILQDARAAPAAARLQRLLVQTQLAFRRFMVINRLSHYQLNNCNIETGEVEAAAPPGHWQKVARVLQDG